MAKSVPKKLLVPLSSVTRNRMKPLGEGGDTHNARCASVMEALFAGNMLLWL